MNPLVMIRSVPQPLKTLLVLWGVCVLVPGVLIVSGVQSALVVLPIGVVAVLTGLTLATDLNGGATAMARHYKTARPMGIDYSNSIYARPWYARLFGVLAIVVGCGFLFGVLQDV